MELIKEETPKEFVKGFYPQAECKLLLSTTWMVFTSKNDAGELCGSMGIGRTEDEAWLFAQRIINKTHALKN